MRHSSFFTHLWEKRAGRIGLIADLAEALASKARGIIPGIPRLNNTADMVKDFLDETPKPAEETISPIELTPEEQAKREQALELQRLLSIPPSTGDNMAERPPVAPLIPPTQDQL